VVAVQGLLEALLSPMLVRLAVRARHPQSQELVSLVPVVVVVVVGTAGPVLVVRAGAAVAVQAVITPMLALLLRPQRIRVPAVVALGRNLRQPMPPVVVQTGS